VVGLAVSDGGWEWAVVLVLVLTGEGGEGKGRVREGANSRLIGGQVEVDWRSIECAGYLPYLTCLSVRLGR